MLSKEPRIMSLRLQSHRIVEYFKRLILLKVSTHCEDTLFFWLIKNVFGHNFFK